MNAKAAIEQCRPGSLIEIVSDGEKIKALTAKVRDSEKPNALVVFGPEMATLVRIKESLIESTTVIDDKPDIGVAIDQEKNEEWGMFAFANKPGSLLRVKNQWIMNIAFRRKDGLISCVRYNPGTATLAKLCPSEFGPGYSRWGMLSQHWAEPGPVFEIKAEAPVFES